MAAVTWAASIDDIQKEMYIVLTVRRSPNLHHIFFSDGQTVSNNKNISVPSLDIPKNKTATMRICFFRKKNHERKTESVNGMFKENNTSLNNNGNRKNRHATYNLDCNVTFKERYNEIFSFSC